jgi:hypothetical protein
VAAKACRVSCKDLDGVRHLVEVTADSVYEAAALALAALAKHDWVDDLGPATRLDIEIIEPAVTHTLLVAQLRSWLNRPATSPADQIRKQKLKTLLARGDGRGFG